MSYYNLLLLLLFISSILALYSSFLSIKMSEAQKNTETTPGAAPTKLEATLIPHDAVQHFEDLIKQFLNEYDENKNKRLEKEEARKAFFHVMGSVHEVDGSQKWYRTLWNNNEKKDNEMFDKFWEMLQKDEHGCLDDLGLAALFKALSQKQQEAVKVKADLENK